MSFSAPDPLFKNPLSLLKKDQDAVGAIASFLPLQTLNAVGQTCRFFHTHQKIERLLNNFRNENDAEKLLQHIAYGEEAEARLMIETNPALLLLDATAKDHAGRTIAKRTAFQCALGAGDLEMCQMIIPHFAQLPDGEAIKHSQYQAQFPTDLPEQKNYDFQLLTKAITEATDNDIELALNFNPRATAVLRAITQLRRDLTPGTVTTGQHFNANDLVQAFTIYDEQSSRWSPMQRELFWCQVIGAVQRTFPACYAQAAAQGTYFLIRNIESLDRNLSFRYDDGSIFPLVSGAGVGFHFALTEEGIPLKGEVREFGCGRWQKGKTSYDIATFCRAKTEGIDNLMQPKRRWCSIS